MKWVDYREKLGIGFSDSSKTKLLANKIATFVESSSLNSDYSSNDYYRFCLMVGHKYSFTLTPEKDLSSLFLSSKLTTPSLISYYVAFVNTQTECKIIHRRKLIIVLQEFLNDLGIANEVIWDDDGAFVFPKGAAELDDALVSQPLEWLSDYPKAHKTFAIALKQYSEGIYIRDVADNLRKALEAFLQEFLENDKNLENNKNEICRYLGSQGVDAGISGLFQPLINAYKNINDRIAKHNDAVDAKLLEFLLYQTGLLIRMVLVVKQSNEDAK